MNEIRVNVGPLTSFNSLIYYIAPKFQDIRGAYSEGKTPSIIFDFKDLAPGSISIPGITALLSSSKRLRDFVGHSLETEMPWNPPVQKFLSDIGFFLIADKFSIFKWDDAKIGGYVSGGANPNNRILYFADILPYKNIPYEEVGDAKAIHKQKIAPNFLLRCKRIFEGFDTKLQSILSNTALELIVNSLMHGEDIAFVGLQRTSKRATVTVCDAGIGFLRSLSRTYPDIGDWTKVTHAGGVLFGCMAQRNEHGLRLAINEVLNYNEGILDDTTNEGWVVISSFDAEIRWQKQNWHNALSKYENMDIRNKEFNPYKLMGDPLPDFADQTQILKGYWRKYKHFLIGSRITFEIPVGND